MLLFAVALVWWFIFTFPCVVALAKIRLLKRERGNACLSNLFNLPICSNSTYIAYAPGGSTIFEVLKVSKFLIEDLELFRFDLPISFFQILLLTSNMHTGPMVHTDILTCCFAL